MRLTYLYLYQDVKGPQTIAFNLPNDERIVKDRGTAMVILKNVSEAKCEIFFNHWSCSNLPIRCGLHYHNSKSLFNISILIRFKQILSPIADACIAKEQHELVDFESFFTHTICHECCHGIGPHTITLPDGQKSTVRLVSYNVSFLFLFYLAVYRMCLSSIFSTT